MFLYQIQLNKSENIMNFKQFKIEAGENMNEEVKVLIVEDDLESYLLT